MDICFVDEGLAGCFREEARAIERWGCEVGRQCAYVLNFLACIDSTGDLGKFSFLDAQRGPDGSSWTVRLTDDWRVAIEVADGGRALVVTKVVESA